MKIINSSVFRKQLPLKTPYKLSFATLRDFQSCIISIETEDGNIGIGEATALTGYSSETHHQIFKVLKNASQKLISLDIHQAKSIVDIMFNSSPFAASAIGTALDFAYTPPHIPDSLTCPLVFPMPSGLSSEQIHKHIETSTKQNFRTLKVKIGLDIDEDLKSLRTILESTDNLKYRFDANQGYSFDEAVRFIKEIEKNNTHKVELVEQPFPPEKWDDMKRLCKLTKIPLMLDESIFDKEDILRAKDIGSDYIKLKLFKSKGLGDLIEKAELAYKIGLKVVLGNGVATDVANLAEAIAFSSFPDFFHGAFEGNGFTRIKSGLLKNTLNLVNGNAHWDKKLPLFDSSILNKELQ